MNKNNVKLGKYRHYKGHISTVIGTAKHSEDPSQEFVIYTHADENGVDQLWARPKDMFMEDVEVGDYRGPRFEYINE